MSGKLLVVRHGESEWNAKGVWTGTTNVHLSKKGFHEADLLGEKIKDIKIDQAFYSDQVRSLETLQGMLKTVGQENVPHRRNSGLNERDYGEYTGKNKWQVKDEVGDETFNKIRRDWNFPVPDGETLKMVYERVIPFYLDQVVPLLKQNKNVLLVAHGNSIRALMKYIESINDDAISHVEMIFGVILIYTVDDDGKKITKSELKIDSPPPKA